MSPIAAAFAGMFAGGIAGFFLTFLIISIFWGKEDSTNLLWASYLVVICAGLGAVIGIAVGLWLARPVDAHLIWGGVIGGIAGLLLTRLIWHLELRTITQGRGLFNLFTMVFGVPVCTLGGIFIGWLISRL